MITTILNRIPSTLLVGVILCLGLGIVFLSMRLESAQKTIYRLEIQSNLDKQSIKDLQSSINKQNNHIKQLEVKISEKPKVITKIQEIVVKDTSCESELDAYKQLFKYMGQQ